MDEARVVFGTAYDFESLREEDKEVGLWTPELWKKLDVWRADALNWGDKHGFPRRVK